jgi:peptide/nickel transport system permease protein
MVKFIVRSILQLVPTLFIVSIITFSVLHFAPGDPLEVMIMSRPESALEDLERLRSIYGLDQPAYIQYLKWLGRLLQGDLGYSRKFGIPVADLLGQRILNTLKLTVTAYGLSVFLGIPIGIYSALRQYKWDEYLITIGAFIGLSMPVFWSGLLMILLFAVRLHWLPPGGISSTGLDTTFFENLKYLIMPALVLGLLDTAVWVRYTRSSMLEEIRQDYVRTARSKGLKEGTVIVRHALRNALIPVITLLGMRLPALFSGAVVTETIFSWPGMGRLNYEAIINEDFAVAMATVLAFTLMVIVGNLVADFLYTLVDPRVRYD